MQTVLHRHMHLHIHLTPHESKCTDLFFHFSVYLNSSLFASFVFDFFMLLCYHSNSNGQSVPSFDWIQTELYSKFVHLKRFDARDENFRFDILLESRRTWLNESLQHTDDVLGMNINLNIFQFAHSVYRAPSIAAVGAYSQRSPIDSWKSRVNAV